MSSLLNLRAELKSKANPQRAKFIQRYFKTGKGEYGEGDVFLGLSSVIMRPIAKKYKELKFEDIQKLLKSKIHEERQTALLILVEQFNQSRSVMIHHNTLSFGQSLGQGLGQNLGQNINKQKQNVVINHHAMLKHSIITRHSAKQDVMLKRNAAMGKSSFAKASEDRIKIFDFYLKNTKYINNWDLVDLSAPKIIGEHLLDKNRRLLYKLVRSKNLWERRIAILATFAFIREKQLAPLEMNRRFRFRPEKHPKGGEFLTGFKDSLKIAEMLLNDKEDLIHKAVGWMLREVGKRSQPTLEKFLKKYASKMPRVMLRYAIEKLPEKKRRGWLKVEK